MKQPVFIFGQIFQAFLQPVHLASVGIETHNCGTGQKDAENGQA
jgi:hypothetical protein